MIAPLNDEQLKEIGCLPTHNSLEDMMRLFGHILWLQMQYDRLDTLVRQHMDDEGLSEFCTLSGRVYAASGGGIGFIWAEQESEG